MQRRTGAETSEVDIRRVVSAAPQEPHDGARVPVSGARAGPSPRMAERGRRGPCRPVGLAFASGGLGGAAAPSAGVLATSVSERGDGV